MRYPKLKAPQAALLGGVDGRVVYEARLDSMRQEQIKLGKETWAGRCARLVRHGKTIATFVASPAQAAKARKQKGTVLVTSKAISRGSMLCVDARGRDAGGFSGARKRRR